MTERLFLKISDGRLKTCIREALEEVFKTTKGRVKVYSDDDTHIASVVKFEILKSGIDFELEEPIPDYMIKKRNLADRVTFKTLEEDKDGNVNKVELDCLYA